MVEKPYNWQDRPLSWSAISSFEYDKEQWYKRYVLRENTPPSAEMLFGSKVGKELEKNPRFLPQIPRLSKMEFAFNVKYGKLNLTGYADTFCENTFRKLGEFKTGKKAWDQKRVDKHGQIDMYLLMNWLMHKVRPESVEIFLVWMPTREQGNFTIDFVQPIEKHIQVFKTKRTMNDIVKFGKRINSIVEQMKEYADSHK